MKFFTTIGGILFLIGAAAHGYRLYSGFGISVNGFAVPVMWSWAAGAVALVMGLGLLSEARRA